MENFDLMAPSFDTDLRIERARAIARKIRTRIDGGHNKRALEFGCGTGLVGFELEDAFEHLLFVDSSPGMIEQLHKKLNGGEHPACQALCSDFTKSIPDDIRVDFVFSSMVLHHVKDVEAILRNLFHLLNEGGRLLIVDLDTDDGSFHAKDPDFDGHNGFEHQALICMAEKAGFNKVVCETFYYDKKKLEGREAPYSLFLLDAEKY